MHIVLVYHFVEIVCVFSQKLWKYILNMCEWCSWKTRQLESFFYDWVIIVIFLYTNSLPMAGKWNYFHKTPIRHVLFYRRTSASPFGGNKASKANSRHTHRFVTHLLDPAVDESGLTDAGRYVPRHIEVKVGMGWEFFDDSVFLRCWQMISYTCEWGREKMKRRKTAWWKRAAELKKQSCWIQ